MKEKSHNNTKNILPTAFVKYLDEMAYTMREAVENYHEAVDDLTSAATVFRSANCVFLAMREAGGGPLAPFPSLDMGLDKRLTRIYRDKFREGLIRQYRDLDQAESILQEGFAYLQDMVHRFAEPDHGLEAVDEALKRMAHAWNKVRDLNRDVYRNYLIFGGQALRQRRRRKH